MPIAAAKKQLRELLRVQQRSLAPRYHASHSAQLWEHLQRSPVWTDAQVIVGFVGVRGEPDTRPALEQALASGRTLLLTRVEPDGLSLARVDDLDALQPAAYAIPAPADDAPSFDPSNLGPDTLVLVPGLAFTESGERLGQGGGFYDRFLVHVDESVPRLGVAFEPFVLATLPVEEHDLRVTHLVTETGLRSVKPRAQP